VHAFALPCVNGGPPGPVRGGETPPGAEGVEPGGSRLPLPAGCVFLGPPLPCLLWASARSSLWPVLGARGAQGSSASFVPCSFLAAATPSACRTLARPSLCLLWASARSSLWPVLGARRPRVLRPRSCLARSSRRLRPRPAEPWHAPRCACFGPPLVPRFGPCSGRGGPGFFVVALSCSFLAATPAPPAEPWHAPSDTPGGSRRLNSRRPTPWGEGGRTLLATPPVVPRGGKADVQPPGVEGVWRAPSEPPRVAAACTAAVDPRGRAASACD
jgi:hypothetical protein